MNNWVTDLTNYNPKTEGHWPKYCTGFNLSKNGRIWLLDNRDIIIDKPGCKGISYPCHRDLIDGENDDKTVYSGLYCWRPRKKDPTLWLYPCAEKFFNIEMLNALKSLIGVHDITENTKVYSNSYRNVISTLNSNKITIEMPK